MVNVCSSVFKSDKNKGCASRLIVWNTNSYEFFTIGKVCGNGQMFTVNGRKQDGELAKFLSIIKKIKLHLWLTNRQLFLMKKVITLCLFTLVCLCLNAQQTEPFYFKNNLQLEFGGHGLIYSVNYERLLVNTTKMKMIAKVGASYYNPIGGTIGFWFPFSVNGLCSFNQHHLEFGIGQILTRERIHSTNNNSLKNWDMLGSMTLGYRWQKPESRFLLRAAFTPFLIINYNQRQDDPAGRNDPIFDSWLIPSGAVSFGYAFWEIS